MMELSKEIYRFSTDPAEKNPYCDIELIVSKKNSFMTSKFAVYLMYPFLGSCLADADCLILQDKESSSQSFDSDESEALLSNLEIPEDVLSSTQSFVDSVSNLEVTDEAPIVWQDAHEKQSSKETSSTSYVCEFCSAQYLNFKKFRQHLSERHKHSFHCIDCQSTFSNKSDLRKHQVKHSKKSHVCPICGVKIKHVKNIPRHLSRHGQDQLLSFQNVLH